MHARRLALLVLAAGLATAGCTAGAAAPLPPARPHVVVTVFDDHIQLGSVPDGQVVFDIRNDGTKRHRLSLVLLPDNLPPLDQQLRGAQREVVTTQAAVADIEPGGAGTFATNLAAGRYGLVDFGADADGASHALQGVNTEFRTG